MNVKEFVRESLDQIIAGVSEAQKQAEKTGAVINPSVHLSNATNTAILKAGSDRLFDSSMDRGSIESVAFDLAVTAEEGSSLDAKAEGTIGIKVAGLSGAGTGSQDSRTTSVSRIKFNVLVKLPQQTEIP